MMSSGHQLRRLLALRSATVSFRLAAASSTSCLQTPAGCLLPARPCQMEVHGGTRRFSSPAERRKRKVALVVGYSGTGYSGSQWNDNSHTIEAELYDAIVKAGGVHERNIGTPSAIKWSRASRTDKGMLIDEELEREDHSLPAVVAEINKHLPPSIRVYNAVRASRKFKARESCNERQYDFLIPYDLLPNLARALDLPTASMRPEETPTLLNHHMRMFRGTRSHHNFTSRKLSRASLHAPVITGSDGEQVDDVWSDDISAWRFDSELFRTIYDFECIPEPALWHSNEQDAGRFWRLRVKGTAFLYHQIRLMVGTSVGCAIGALPHNMPELALTLPMPIRLPLAPSASLLLGDQGFGDDCKLQMSPRQTDVRSSTAVGKTHSEYITLMNGEALDREQAFLSGHLWPHLHELVLGPESEVMDTWVHEMECCRLSEDSDKWRLFSARYQAWCDSMEKRRARKQQHHVQAVQRMQEEFARSQDPTSLIPPDESRQVLPKFFQKVLPSGLGTELTLRFGLGSRDHEAALVQRGCALRLLRRTWAAEDAVTAVSLASLIEAPSPGSSAEPSTGTNTGADVDVDDNAGAGAGADADTGAPGATVPLDVLMREGERHLHETVLASVKRKEKRGSGSGRGRAPPRHSRTAKRAQHKSSSPPPRGQAQAPSKHGGSGGRARAAGGAATARQAKAVSSE